MDMQCSKCSEPWDWFYIRDDVLRDETLYQRMAKTGGYVVDSIGIIYGTSAPYELTPFFRLRKDIRRTTQEMEAKANWQFNPGPTIAQCPACIGKVVEQTDAAKIRSELATLYGDDIDGFMADMEDFGLTE